MSWFRRASKPAPPPELQVGTILTFRVSHMDREMSVQHITYNLDNDSVEVVLQDVESLKRKYRL